MKKKSKKRDGNVVTFSVETDPHEIAEERARREAETATLAAEYLRGQLNGITAALDELTHLSAKMPMQGPYAVVAAKRGALIDAVAAVAGVLKRTSDWGNGRSPTSLFAVGDTHAGFGLHMNSIFGKMASDHFRGTSFHHGDLLHVGGDRLLGHKMKTLAVDDPIRGHETKVASDTLSNRKGVRK